MGNVSIPMILRNTRVIVLTDSLEWIAKFECLAVSNLAKTMEYVLILKIISKMEGKVKKKTIFVIGGVKESCEKKIFVIKTICNKKDDFKLRDHPIFGHKLFCFEK